MENGYEKLCSDEGRSYVNTTRIEGASIDPGVDLGGGGGEPANASSMNNFSSSSWEETAVRFYQVHCVPVASDSNNALRIGLQVSSLILIFLSSFVSNTMVFLVFFRRPSLLTTSNRFVLNLAISNFLMTLVVMPFIIASYIMVEWPLGRLWCQVTGVLTTLLFVACIFTLLLIAVDRFYAIMKPLHYDLHMTCRKACLFIGTLWAVSLGIAIPPAFGWNTIVYQAGKGLCTVLWKSPLSSDRLYSFFVVLSCFVLPYAAMLWIYVTVFKEAQKTTALARRNSTTMGDGCGEGGLPGLLIQQQQQQQQIPPQRRRSSAASLLTAVYRRSSSVTSRSLLGSLHRDDWKAAKTSLLVMSTFTLCWLPFFILIVLEASLGVDTHAPWWLETASIWSALVGCALNPLVYVFRNASVKHELRMMFCPRDFAPPRLERINTSGSIRDVLRERKASLGPEISKRDSVIPASSPLVVPTTATFRISPQSSCASLQAEVADPSRSTVTFIGVHESKSIKDAVRL